MSCILIRVIASLYVTERVARTVEHVSRSSFQTASVAVLIASVVVNVCRADRSYVGTAGVVTGCVAAVIVNVRNISYFAAIVAGLITDVIVCMERGALKTAVAYVTGRIARTVVYVGGVLPLRDEYEVVVCSHFVKVPDNSAVLPGYYLKSGAVRRYGGYYQLPFLEFLGLDDDSGV